MSLVKHRIYSVYSLVHGLTSLIRDQVYHLKEAKVPVAMLVGTSSKEETKEVMEAMLGGKSSQPRKKGKKAMVEQGDLGWGYNNEQDDDAIKLVYVTPEKIAKSKHFVANLEQVYASGRLSRIVIDEC